MGAELGPPMKAESIVVAPANAEGGERCVRILMVSQDGSRMTADLPQSSAKELAVMMADAAESVSLQMHTIPPASLMQ